MSDQPQVSAGAQPGQAATTFGQSQTQAPAPQPKYITLEEAQRIAKESADEAFRRAQGLYDKGQQKVKEELTRLDNLLKMQAEAGTPVPPATADAMRQRVIADAFKSEPATTPVQQAAPTGPVSQQPAPVQPQVQAPDPITAEAIRLQQEAGIVLGDSDPEISVIVQDQGPYGFLKSVEQAIALKRQRMTAATRTNIPGLGAGTGAMGADALVSRIDPV
jgi:hypothetical protein